jgi:hypothetical protein
VSDTVCPAIVIEPDRTEVELFAATEKKTVPLPFPEAPPVTFTKAELLAAVQLHPADVVTLTVPDPPEDANEEGVAGPTV